MEKESIVYFGESLQYLFNHMEINIIIGNIKVNLLDYLPLLKQGFSTISSLRSILSTYIGFYGIDQIEQNKIFEEAFGSDIPAEFFSIYLFEVHMANYKKPRFFDDYLTSYEKHDITSPLYKKILMSEAIERGYISKPMNTNNIIDFDGDYYDFGINGYVDGIIFYNIYSKEYFPELSEYEENNEIMKTINMENDIILSIENIDNDGNEIDLLLLKHRMRNTLKRILLADRHIKLYVAIILNDVRKVVEFLKDIDPRLYNNEAYHLALKMRNKKIITAVRKRIIELNWYERLVYESGLGSNVASDIYSRKY